MLGMNSDLFRKDCFKVGNAFTFKEVRDMAMSEESADKQLQLMNTEVYGLTWTLLVKVVALIGHKNI